jgi:Flp pilus assembly protein TadG
VRNPTRSRTGGTERGQTLVIFALVLSLFLVWMIALVADVGTLYVAYDRLDNAALLAAQAGASAVDTGQLYQGNLRLDVGQAKLFCQQSLGAAGVRGSCDQTTALLVVADVREAVQLPVTLLGQSAVVHIQHAARPAYGGGVGTVTT